MGFRQSKEEFRGAEDAAHFILIEYCGGWGYYKYAAEVADRIEAKYPNKFRFELRPDKGTTGRLEVTIFPNSKAPSETGGIQVHSKAKGDGYANKNWAGFDERLTEKVAALAWNSLTTVS
jgi:selT/selW/selH-like putative selenoprotein